jgi:UPF0755 protein
MARPGLIRKLLAAGALSLAVGALAWSGLARLDRYRLEQPIAGLTAPRVVVVARGGSLNSVARMLAEEGLLAHPASFVRQARREDLAGRIRAGEYRVEPGTTPGQLLALIVAGEVLLHSVTLPEGWTFDRALAMIRAHPAVVASAHEAGDRELLEAIGLGGRHPEGMLFPDTYRFPRGTRDTDILRQARDRLESELQLAWSSRKDDLPLASAYEALILASIVERETGVPDERPMIAGVFTNRLRLGMRLQTDPTVIYGMGTAFDGNLRRADMLRDTPYNTYTRAGLPPTPIALAGRDALRAAVGPADTEALYFVATGLGDGRHRFARSLAEHNDNVARYIAALRGAAREGSP